MRIGINFKPLDMRFNDLDGIKKDIIDVGFKSKEETDFIIKLENNSAKEKFQIKIFKTGDFTFYGNYEKIDSYSISSLLTKAIELLSYLKSKNYIQAKFHQKINFLFFGVQNKLDINKLKNIIRDIGKVYFEKCKVNDVFQNKHLLKLTSYQKIENLF